jgi:Protein of unknown function (DUF3302)
VESTFGPLDAFAFGVFAVLIFVAVFVVVGLGKLPGQLARKWGHPQAAAINAMSWIGIATGGLLWPVGSAQIGVAKAQLYPAISITGTFGGSASTANGHNLGQVVSSKGVAYAAGPSFQWNILNYGQITNNVRLCAVLY